MADHNKEQFDEALVSALKILETYRRNRRHLAEGQAKLGGKLDLELKNNIDWHDEQIQIYETEVARLKTEQVVNQFSIAEAEYRRDLAHFLGASDGRLSVSDNTSLEFLRLQLGLPLERVRAIEQEIRVQLAEERFYAIDDIFIRMGGWLSKDVGLIGRVVRLDAATAIRLLVQYTAFTFDVGTLIESRRHSFLRDNHVWPETKEYDQFTQFFGDLIQALGRRFLQGDPPPSPPMA